MQRPQKVFNFCGLRELSLRSLHEISLSHYLAKPNFAPATAPSFRVFTLE